MASVEETRGQVARAMAGAQAVEIKATIPEQQIDQALELYRLQPDDTERYIFFFDTPALELFKDGVIARARRIVGDEHDSTIKFRPVVPESIPTLWRKYSGFKIEADCGENGVVKSASLTMPVPRGRIKRVTAGKEPIASLFTEEQLLFLLTTANKKFDYDKVVPMGPIRVWRWRFQDPGLPWPLTAELWQREDGSRLAEVSIKAPVVQAAAAKAGFMAFLAEVGAKRDDGQQAKTRWALEFEASKHKQRLNVAHPREDSAVSTEGGTGKAASEAVDQEAVTQSSVAD